MTMQEWLTSEDVRKQGNRTHRWYGRIEGAITAIMFIVAAIMFLAATNYG